MDKIYSTPTRHIPTCHVCPLYQKSSAFACQQCTLSCCQYPSSLKERDQLGWLSRLNVPCKLIVIVVGLAIATGNSILLVGGELKDSSWLPTRSGEWIRLGNLCASSVFRLLTPAKRKTLIMSLHEPRRRIPSLLEKGKRHAHAVLLQIGRAHV